MKIQDERNLHVTPLLKSGISSEPNLHDFGIHFDFPGVG